MSKMIAGFAVIAALIGFALPTSAAAASQQDGVRTIQAGQSEEFSSRRYYRRYYRPYGVYRPYYRPYRSYGYQPYYRPYYRPYRYYW